MKKLITNIRFGLLYIISLLPLRVHYIFSDLLAFVLHRIVRYRYQVITANIARSFPEYRYDDIKKLTKQYYGFMCDIIAESVWSLAHCANAIRERVRVENLHLLDELQQSRNNVLIVMGHCGNWELISGMIMEQKDREEKSFAFNPVYIVYKAAHKKSSDAIFKKIRMHEYKKFGSKGGVLESNSVIRHAIKHREDKGVYVMIADQNPVGGKEIIVDFLNQKTAMLGGPNYLATKLNMPVVYLYMDRVARGRYNMRLTLIAENPSECEEGYITRTFAKLLEQDIKANRVNWLWSHKRWKRKI
ncbi:MAG: lysophospholipid acyltransferase family protein [Bacteroidales bacterium]|nr:lysophospholipid acyltransferase family protein [Bacteroidales bacterium]